MTGAALAGWAVEALVASALLIAAVMLVRVPVRRAFGPGIAYLLWCLPALRLILPPLPAAWGLAAHTPIARMGDRVSVLVVDAGSSAAVVPTGAGVSIGAALGLLWGTGAVALLLFYAVRHVRFCTGMLRSATVLEQVGGVRVVVSAAVGGPLAFGIWRRYVALPHDVAERYDAEERALAMAHEIGHHQRGDLLANWLALVVLAVHWFNPLVWHAFAAFRCDQELANDARVLAGRTPAQRHAYGRAIVKAAGGGLVSPACHLHRGADLKGRLRMLARSPSSRRQLLSGATTVTALVLAGLGLTASGTGAAAIAASVKGVVGVPPALPILVEPAPVVDAGKRPAVVRVGSSEMGMGEGRGRDRFRHGTAAEAPRAMHGIVVPAVAPAPDVDMPVLAFHLVPDTFRAPCSGSDAARQLVERRSEDGRQFVIVCTDRIDAVTRDAGQVAANTIIIERRARVSARINLAVARVAIERERALSDDQRREALDGVELAEAELASAAD